jgi:hypothetical protein
MVELAGAHAPAGERSAVWCRALRRLGSALVVVLYPPEHHLEHHLDVTAGSPE